MSEKIELNLVAGAMTQTGIEPEKIKAVLDALKAELAADAKEDKQPAVKKQFVIVVSDPLGHLVGKDFAGWVCQLEENEHPATTVERIETSAHQYNATKKGRLRPVQTIGEACEAIPSRMLKGNSVWVKTKTPVLIVRTKNEIDNVPGILPGQSAAA
jgi:hypothetical protein